MPVSVLVVEDEIQLGEAIKKGLTESGMEVVLATNGQQALDTLCDHDFQVIVSDRMMPGMSGTELIQLVRSSGKNIPILLLTALGTTENKIEGFESGADDYLTKPFDFRELVLRIRALAKRTGSSIGEDIIQCKDLQVDLLNKKVTRKNNEIQLTQREFDLLHYFVQHPNRLISKKELIEKVWGLNFDPGTNILEVYINYLRSKINKGQDEKLIETVHGQGYRLNT